MLRKKMLLVLALVLLLMPPGLACNGQNRSGSSSGAAGPASAEKAAAPEPPLADWPPAAPGEDASRSDSVIGDILGKMPPTLLVGDALIYPGDTASIVLKLGRGFGSTSIKTYGGYTVVITDAEGKEVKRERTDQNGQIPFERKFEQAGNYFFRAGVDGKVEETDVRPALFCVYVRAKESPMVICDMDKTLVQSGFLRVVTGGAQPFDHAAEVVGRLVKEKRLTVLYLTHRPDFFEASSKQWLRLNRFPPGPLYTGDIGGLLAGSGAFKSGELGRIKQRFANLKLGIGDKYSDTAAYVANDIRPVLIPDIKWDKEKADYWQEQLRELEGLKSDVTVCRNWFEIEEALFGEKEFPPKRLIGPVKDMIKALQRGGK